MAHYLFVLLADIPDYLTGLPILFIMCGFFFLLQLLLCLLIRRRQWPKLIPAFFILSEWVDLAIYYYVAHAPGLEAYVMAYIIGFSTGGIVLAWIVYGLIVYDKEEKRIEIEKKKAAEEK